MKKHIIRGIFLFVELALFIGSFAVKHFTAKKMGMARHVIYTNQLWEKTYPLAQWKLVSILVLAALLALVLVLLLVRRKKLTLWLWTEGVLSLGITGYSLFFTLSNSAAVLRPYYWMSPLFALAALLQLVRTLILLCHK